MSTSGYVVALASSVSRLSTGLDILDQLAGMKGNDGRDVFPSRDPLA